jgi:hypothetical protein
MVDIKYYTVKQVAEIFGCDDETVTGWINSSQLAAHDICKTPGGKRPTWRIAEADLGRFLIARRKASDVAPLARQRTPKQPQPKQYV